MTRRPRPLGGRAFDGVRAPLAAARPVPCRGPRIAARSSRVVLLVGGGLLAGCASLSVPMPMPAPAPEDAYTAETTYAKLVGEYPFIRMASRDAPAEVRVLRDMPYVAYGSRVLQLDLVLPQRAAAAPVPAIVLVHGGGWRVGERRNLLPLAIGLAQRGYAAATVSYRLSGEAPYPAAIHDVKAAVRWLRAQAPVHGIDAARIAVGGGSAGGQIAALVGVTNGVPRFDPQATAGGVPGGISSEVQAIVNIDGLSDFSSEAARLHEDDPRKNPSAAGAWFGGRYAERPALWHEASPIFHVRRETPPVLFVISAQPRFSLGHPEMMARLQALGVATRVVQMPDTPHSFWLFEPWLAPTVAAVADFLDAHLARQH